VFLSKKEIKDTKKKSRENLTLHSGHKCRNSYRQMLHNYVIFPLFEIAFSESSTHQL